MIRILETLLNVRFLIIFMLMVMLKRDNCHITENIEALLIEIVVLTLKFN